MSEEKDKKELDTKAKGEKSEKTTTRQSKDNKSSKKNSNVTNKTTKKQVENRFADVIEKMEEETKKVEKNKINTKENHQQSENKKSNIPKKTTNSNKTTDKTKNNLPLKQIKELEMIEELKKQATLPKEKMNKIYIRVFKNLLFAIIILMYFILINIGSISISPNVFITDLKVFSMVFIIVTICIFEKAYKKDSGKLTITGIEFLAISICSLLCIRIYTIYNNNFKNMVTLFALLFVAYYVVKAIIIYVKKRKKLKKQSSEIHKIAKKKRGN